MTFVSSNFSAERSKVFLCEIKKMYLEHINKYQNYVYASAYNFFGVRITSVKLLRVRFLGWFNNIDNRIDRRGGLEINCSKLDKHTLISTFGKRALSRAVADCLSPVWICMRVFICRGYNFVEQSFNDKVLTRCLPLLTRLHLSRHLFIGQIYLPLRYHVID